MLLDIFRVVGGIFLGLAVAVILLVLGLGAIFREVRRIESDYEQ
jgi:threonine/homoserine/homoserine lactone efflux protein